MLNKKKKNNNSSNSLVFGLWPQTKMFRNNNAAKQLFQGLCSAKSQDDVQGEGSSVVQ